MKIGCILFIGLIPLNLLSQGLNNLWMMGYANGNPRPWGGVNLNFISGSIDTSYQNRIMNFRDANGRDWWLFCHKFNNDKYFKFLVSANGIQGPETQNLGSSRGVYFGQMVFSPDGTKAAYYEPKNDLDIMDFDRCTGDFSNLIHV